MLRSASPSTQISQLQANTTMAVITIPTATAPSSGITLNRLGCIFAITRHRHGHCRIRTFPVLCSSSGSNSKPRRGFGPPPSNKKKANKVTTSGDKQAMLEKRKLSTKQSGTVNRAPALSLRTDGKSNSISTDLQFEERLEAVKRSTLEQKKFDQSKEYGAIDYDEPIASDPSTIGLGTKIGIGVAVVAFGLVFALGDFLPTTSDTPTKEATVVRNKLSEEEKQSLQARLQQYEARLAASPDDPTALEGAAVTLTELEEYTRAATMLEDLAKKKSNDPDVFRLLGEAKYELRDYDGSAAAYKRSAMVSKTVNFEVLHGLTNALLAAKRPDEAVQVLLASRERLNTEKSNDHGTSADESTYQLVDPIQVEMLLGKAYSDWGHVSDAVSVYDQLISSHPDDFRGYLAKGIILKENGRVGEAERMFIQARFFAPENAKALVDRYSRQ